MATATWTVWPTENNIHHTAGEVDAQNWTETMQRRQWDPESEDVDSIPIAERSRVWVKDDGDFTSTPTGLNTDIGAGVLTVAGYVIEQVGAHTITLTASSDNYLWIVLPMATGLVSGDPVWTKETSISTIPLRGVLLWILTTDGSSVTASADRRPLDHPDWVQGTYAGAASGTENISWGFSPSRVDVMARTDQRASAYALRGATHTVNRTWGPIDATQPTKQIVLQTYGFSITKGGGTDSDLGENSTTYDYRAYR
jgi:hypothetical protein